MKELTRSMKRAYLAAARLADRHLKRGVVSLEKPVFIWGTGRSGTHLLLDILSLHPSLMCPLMAGNRWKKGLWGDMHWGDTTPEPLKGHRIPYEGFQRLWLDAGLAFDAIGLLHRDCLSPDLAERVRDRFRDLHRVWLWKPAPSYRALDKTPVYILMVDVIDALFPDAYHVFCIRDPRAVLNSLLRVGRYQERSDKGRGRIDEIGFWSVVPPGYEKHRHEPLVKRLSWQVKALYELGFGHRDLLGDRLVPFHYERLLDDAHESVSELFDRLELPPWPAIREAIPARFPDYSPPWPRDGRPPEEPFGKRRCYKDDEIEQLSEIEDLAVRIGYEPQSPGRLRNDRT